MHLADIPQAAWLALLCSPPLLLALLFAFRSGRVPDIGAIRIGNPLLKPDALPSPHEPELRPLLRVIRSHNDADLRAIILGLRHLPLKETASILRRYQHSPDPELQIYAQSVLQEKQDELQNRFAKLLARADSASPSIVASCLEAGLDLASMPLTPDPERVATLRKILPHADAVRDSGANHPRAVFAAARFYLLTNRLANAAALHDRLPAGTPLHESLGAQLKHRTSITQPPAPMTTGYTIH